MGLTEVTCLVSSVVMGIAALNVIVHKYHAPGGLWTVSEGLSRIPREFTVAGFILGAATGIIGMYFELYKNMLEKIKVKPDRRVRCCGLPCLTNNGIKILLAASTVVGALSMIPTAYYRTGYDGEKKLHTLSSVGVFQAVT